MSESAKLVERLREEHEWLAEEHGGGISTQSEAADAIERLERELAEARQVAKQLAIALCAALGDVPKCSDVVIMWREALGRYEAATYGPKA